MNKVQYSIQMKDINHKDTFESKFYIKSNDNYIKILEQLIEELKKYNLEFDSQGLTMILMNNKNPREACVILERVK
jgi:predicted AlkP superfamily pyrophosphatase or phosphodiesterase